MITAWEPTYTRYHWAKTIKDKANTFAEYLVNIVKPFPGETPPFASNSNLTLSLTQVGFDKKNDVNVKI